MGKIIVGNWKMNGSRTFIDQFIPSIKQSLAKSSNQIILCPPFPYLIPIKAALGGTALILGAQNCHSSPSGAFTGEVSAPMLTEIGCKAVILGHSERRTYSMETDELVQAKAASVHESGMITIICIGESLEVRQSGKAITNVCQQLLHSVPSSATPQNTFIAYEPIWAIGTGLTASLDEIAIMHQALRSASTHPFPLLYGGSVTDQNAKDILSLPVVDGILVGGASLKADSFTKICL